MHKIILSIIMCINIINTRAMEQEQKNILQASEKSSCSISQLLENPSTPKRLKLEINDLLQNKNFVTDVYSVNSKTHPFEIKIAFYDDKNKCVLKYKMPQDYPFYAPILSLTTNNDQFNAKDLIAIEKDLHNDLRSTWSPAIRMNKIIDMTNSKIKSYEDRKIASQRVAEGYERTLIHLKEKYQSTNVYSNATYPEFQEKLHGLWIDEMPSGYFVFHVEYNYINIAFEPKYIGAEPLSYHGYCAVGYCTTNNNEFDILITDAADLGKINRFKVTVHPDFISVQFYSLNNDSILDAIISQIEKDCGFRESFNLIKI